MSRSVKDTFTHFGEKLERLAGGMCTSEGRRIAELRAGKLRGFREAWGEESEGADFLGRVWDEDGGVVGLAPLSLDPGSYARRGVEKEVEARDGEGEGEDGDDAEEEGEEGESEVRESEEGQTRGEDMGGYGYAQRLQDHPVAHPPLQSSTNGTAAPDKNTDPRLVDSDPGAQLVAEMNRMRESGQ